MVNASAVNVAVTMEAMLLEPLLEPLFTGCDAVGQIEAGEFAMQIARQLEVRA